MYVFAEPVTEARADEIQNTGAQYAKEWARRVVGVGKNDPEAKEEWQDLQEEVDEQVSEDGAAGNEVGSAAGNKADSTAPSQQVEVSAEGETTVDNAEASNQNEAENESEHDTSTSTPAPAALAGWTLTIRNKINGHYLKRPDQLEPEDNWQIEYNMQPIASDSVERLYRATTERRRQLIGLDDEVDKGLQIYRKTIQRYASKGRVWRAEQDRLDEQRGVRLFRPLGPGKEGE